MIATIIDDNRCGMSDVAFRTAPPACGLSCLKSQKLQSTDLAGWKICPLHRRRPLSPTTSGLTGLASVCMSLPLDEAIARAVFVIDARLDGRTDERADRNAFGPS